MEQNRITIHWNHSYSEVPATVSTNCSKKSAIRIQNNETKMFLSNSISGQMEEDPIFTDENHTKSNYSPEEFCLSREFLVQLGIVFVASLLMFITGMHTGWVGPTILKLSSNNSEIPLTPTEISWLTAMVPFGGGIGPIFGAILANKIGRKNTILLTTIPEIFTWIAIIYAKDIYWLCTAQFIRGVTGGSAFAVIPMYVGEISSPKFRGNFGMLFVLLHHSGLLFEVALVPYVSISLNAWISLTIPTFLVAVFIWMPESPYYLLMKNQTENAGKSLQILKQNDNIDKQLEHLNKVVRDEQNEVDGFTGVFRARNNRVSFILCLGIMSIQHLTGLMPVVVYAQLLLEKSNSSIDPNISGIIIQTFGVIGLVLGCFMIDSYGRRSVLLFSTFGTIIPFLLIGVYFYLDNIQYDHTSSFSLFPLIGLILHQFTALLGITPMPYVYMSEAFSTNVKGFASLFVICYGSIIHSISCKIYPDLRDTIGIHNVFFLLIFGCLLSGVGTYFFVPETKGKTLHEIQQLFKKYKFVSK